MIQINYITKKPYDEEAQEVLTLSQLAHEFKSIEWMNHIQARAVGRKPRAGLPGTTIMTNGKVTVVFNKDQTFISRK